MATQTAVLHPDPVINKALTENARNGHKYNSAAEMCRAIGITDLATQRRVRQVLRDADLGVGRGNRYAGITAPVVVKAAKSRKAQAKATGEAAKPKAAKKGASKKTTAPASDEVAATA